MLPSGGAGRREEEEEEEEEDGMVILEVARWEARVLKCHMQMRRVQEELIWIREFPNTSGMMLHRVLHYSTQGTAL